MRKQTKTSARLLISRLRSNQSTLIAAALLISTLVPFTARASAPQAAAGCAQVKTLAHFCRPGLLPGGTYVTRNFMPGLRVTVPGGGWRGGEDSSLELRLEPPGHPGEYLRFWLDPHASTPCSGRLLPVDTTTPGLVVRWLRRNKNLAVSAPRRKTIAGGLASISVDLDDSAVAPRCDPTCPPGPCIGYFLFAGDGYSEAYGTGARSPVRFYFAHVGPPTHVFTVGIESSSPKQFPLLLREVAPIVAHVRLPAKLPPERR